MLRTYSRQASPVCSPSSPIRYSSNLELCGSGSCAVDQDWMDGELERARLQRAPFYRRLTTTRRRWDHHHDADADASALDKFRKSPEAEAVTPPHSSWRFYTSFDNGEWRRHAVPVLKEAEDALAQAGQVNGLARFSRHGGGAPTEGGCSAAAAAAEIGLRMRGRQSRTMAAGEGDSLSDRRRCRRGVLSCSMDSFRGITASGAVCTDFPAGVSDYFARDTGRSLSPRSQPFSTSGGDVSIFDDDVTCDDVMRDDVTCDDSPRKQRLPFVLTGSVKINGVEAWLEDKVIVPTKYKNTATGIPEIKISAETRDSTSGDDDVISRKFGRRSVTARRFKTKADEDRGEAKGQRPNCTTGVEEEDRPLKAFTKTETDSLERNRQNEGGNSPEKEISIRNKEQNKNSRLIVGRRSESVRMRGEQSRANGKWGGLESGLTPERETGVEIHTRQDTINHNTALGTLSSADAAAAEDKVTKADDKTNRADDGRCRRFSREMDRGTVPESTTVPLESRDAEIQRQNQELTSRACNVNATKVALPENANDEHAMPRFISQCFVSINSGQETTGETKSAAKDAGTRRSEVLSKTETKDFSNGKIPETFDDSEWIVEMAVRD